MIFIPPLLEVGAILESRMSVRPSVSPRLTEGTGVAKRTKDLLFFFFYVAKMFFYVAKKDKRIAT